MKYVLSLLLAFCLSLSSFAKTNEIGENMGGRYGLNYLYTDFKKKGGYHRSIELSNKYGLYRQEYCGCIYSKKESEDRKKGLKEAKK